MKTFTSTIIAIAIASFASVSMANDVKSTGFNGLDNTNSVCAYGKRIDRKRDLNCIN